MPVAAVDDIELYYEERGEGPALLLIAAASSRVLEARIPDSRLHTLARSGHLFFIERPAETQQLVSAFLAETAGTSA
jgi:pimeloyl-ACP methyl ester carboxylesterase